MSHPSSARPLQGRTALVTGVSRRRGIGYAVAVELASLGASVFFHRDDGRRFRRWCDSPLHRPPQGVSSSGSVRPHRGREPCGQTEHDLIGA